MNRTRASIALLLLFLAAFISSGVDAVCTVKETTVFSSFSHLKSVYSLSSAPVLLIALIVMFSVIALICFIGKQRNVGFFFMSAVLLMYVLFLITYCAETRNNAMYNELNAQFLALGKKVKKRDFHIQVIPQKMCYVTAALAAAVCAVSLPEFRTSIARYKLKKEIEPYLFISPHILLFIVFTLIPILYGCYTAFTKWDMYNEPVFAGFSNLYTILLDHGNTYYNQLRNGLRNTFIFVLYTTPLCIVLPLGIALALKKIARGSKVLQAIFYLPSLMSITSIIMSWKNFFDYNYGFANNFFGFNWNWFAPPQSWIMLVVISVWSATGANMVIYQSALAGVPQQLYEAASIDGANSWTTFWKITLPNIRYPLLYTLVTTLIARFNVYEIPSLTMEYEFGEANAVLMMYIKDTAFKQGVAGIASAMALILAVILMGVSWIQIRMMRKEAMN